MKVICRVLIAGLTMLSQSCTKPPCECDIVYVNSIRVQFVNQQGQNLFSGASGIYNADSVRVLNKINNFDLNDAAVIKDPNDSSSLQFSFYTTETVKSYIYYNIQAQTDSMELITITKTGTCCGNKEVYKEIVGVKFNNVAITPTNGKFIFVK